jgi:DNA (cytosine-5)-methyltransferase 1
MTPLVLSLFPGIGLLDMAFELEGFCVVRGPDLLWGGDVRRFHPPAGRFDGVIGGPPCQAFSVFRHINPLAGQKHGNLIPEHERVVAESAPMWFVMENVRDAPLPVVDGYSVHAQLVKDVWVGGETMRVRRISFGTPHGARLGIEQVALHTEEPTIAAYAGGTRAVPVRYNQGKVEKRRLREHKEESRETQWARQLRQQGLPADFLADAPFTMSGKAKAVGNGVPLPMGRAIARAVKAAMYPAQTEGAA